MKIENNHQAQIEAFVEHQESVITRLYQLLGELRPMLVLFLFDPRSGEYHVAPVASPAALDREAFGQMAPQLIGMLQKGGLQPLATLWASEAYIRTTNRPEEVRNWKALPVSHEALVLGFETHHAERLIRHRIECPGQLGAREDEGWKAQKSDGRLARFFGAFESNN